MTDDDCLIGEVCEEGLFVCMPNACESDNDCPGAQLCIDGVCLTPLCAPAGVSCEGEEFVPCCDGLICNDESVCEAIAEPTCVATGEPCNALPAAGDLCCSGLVCVESTCQAVDDGEDPGGTDDGGEVTTLPDTGVTGNDDGINLAAAAGLAVGVATLLGGRRLRQGDGGRLAE